MNADLDDEVAIRSLEQTAVAAQLRRLTAADVAEEEHRLLDWGQEAAVAEQQAELACKPVVRSLRATSGRGVHVAFVVRPEGGLEVEGLEDGEDVGRRHRHTIPRWVVGAEAGFVRRQV